MSGFTLAFISFIRRPISSFLAVCSLVIPLVAMGVVFTLIGTVRESIQKYDSSVDAILGPKTSDIELVMASLFGVGQLDRILPYGLLQHAREPMKKKQWELRDVASSQETVNVVKQATPYMEFAKFKDYKVIGTDDTFLQRPDENMQRPQIAKGKWFDTAEQVVVGSLVAQREHLHLGSTLIAESRFVHPITGKPLWKKSLTVAGILDSTGILYDHMIYTHTENPFELYRTAIPLNLMRETRNHIGMSYALLWLYPGQENRLQDHFDHYTVGKIVFIRDQMTYIVKLLGGGASLGKWVSGITVILGILCIMVLFNARFEAMGEDLAISRTLGYSKMNVASWLMWESLILCLSAMPCVLALEWLLIRFMNTIPGISMFHFDLLWPTPYHPWIWGFMFIGCPFALIIPLLRLYQHNLHHSLRGM